MKKTGNALMPLHGGHCPPWLFKKMTHLSVAIIEAMLIDFNSETILKRLADPIWFQSFGSLLGFDWHSSGLTTVVLGALKEGLRDRSHELGLYVAGGKGKVSRATPQEILEYGTRDGLHNDSERLIHASKMAAKIDSAVVQDGYQLYHHVMIFDRDAKWTVIQQGLNDNTRYARRYHWLSTHVTNFVQEPHSSIVGAQEPHVLDLTSQANEPLQTHSTSLTTEPRMVLDTLRTLEASQENGRHVQFPRHHAIPSAKHIDKILYKIYEHHPQNYETLVGLSGVGPSTIRALAMTAEIIYGTPITYRDPVRYSFAHGGKDNIPFPVNRGDYEHTLATLRDAITRAKIGEPDKMALLRQASEFSTLPPI